MSDFPSHSAAAISRITSLPDFEAVLQALPAAVYTTDAKGVITFYNEAAAELWGVRPKLGHSEFCGSWKLFWPDGRPMPHSECPMATALREQRPNRGHEAIAERPDGSRIRFQANPTPLFDPAGRMIGSVNMLIDVSEQHRMYVASQRLAAIVESSEEAILSKDLNGVIQSWNRGAERLFGYTADEVIGRPVTILIPKDRLDEEPGILAKIRRGERVDHYETVRQRKDGSAIDISLSVSPIRDSDGTIVGASKIARDISAKRLAEQQQQLLLREMNHRIKNLFTLAGSVVSLSARTVRDVPGLVSAVRERLSALAEAHGLTVANRFSPDAQASQSTMLHTLSNTVLRPYAEHSADGSDRIKVEGDDMEVGGTTLTGFALLLHELATNAAKYGALSSRDGHLRLIYARMGERLEVTWQESGANLVKPAGPDGFGSLIARATTEGQLGGELRREWRPDGLTVHCSVPLERLKLR